MFLATTILYIDRQILSLLKGTLDQEFHWTNEQFGDVTAAFQVSYGIGLLGYGWFVDRFGVKIGYAMTMAGSSLAAVEHSAVFAVRRFCHSGARRWVWRNRATFPRQSKGWRNGFRRRNGRWPRRYSIPAQTSVRSWRQQPFRSSRRLGVGGPLLSFWPRWEFSGRAPGGSSTSAAPEAKTPQPSRTGMD